MIQNKQIVSLDGSFLSVHHQLKSRSGATHPIDFSHWSHPLRRRNRPVTHGAFLDLPKWGRKICGVGGFFEKWEKIGEKSGKGYENLGFN